VRPTTFVKCLELDSDTDEVFRWHTRPGAFERLLPPWESVRVLDRGNGVAPDSRVSLETRIGPFSKRWLAVHSDVQEGRSFTDEQLEGPFESWVHTHTVVPSSGNGGGSVLEDRVEYALPGGTVGNVLAGAWVRRKLERMFEHRHRVLERDLRLHVKTSTECMKILVSGSSGLVGSALVPFLTTGGHEVRRLLRGSATGGVSWDPEGGRLDPAELEGLDAVVHLAGENIAARRWNTAQKTRIASSRVSGTRLLCEALAGLEEKPEVLVCASAIGIYGDRKDEEVDEESLPGSGFLAEVCRDWEAATKPAIDAGIRVVHLRFGVILSPKGGALAKMLPPFKLGGGGPVGSGDQYMSWISLDDAVGAIHHAIATESISGPVNAVAPHPVTNRDFARTLGKVLSRPAFVPMPAFAARLAFGEMADELLLAGQRVRPKVLLETGYEFDAPELEIALRQMLGKPHRA
jgi:uncharacterized protein (TIGR01777 family)